MKSGMHEEEIVFSDEKVFTVEAQFNHQNDRVLAKHSSDVPKDILTVTHCQKPESVNGMGSSVQNMEVPPDFCERGGKSEHKYVHQ